MRASTCGDLQCTSAPVLLVLEETQAEIGRFMN